MISAGGMNGNAARFIDHNILSWDLVYDFDWDGSYRRFVAMDDIPIVTFSRAWQLTQGDSSYSRRSPF